MPAAKAYQLLRSSINVNCHGITDYPTGNSNVALNKPFFCFFNRFVDIPLLVTYYGNRRSILNFYQQVIQKLPYKTGFDFIVSLMPLLKMNLLK
jgi:hypothetical protein